MASDRRRSTHRAVMAAVLWLAAWALGWSGRATHAAMRPRQPGELFSFPKSLAGAGASATQLTTSVSGDGSTIALAWNEPSGSSYLARAAVSADGGVTWSGSVTVGTSANAVAPVLSMSQDGGVVLLSWQEGTSNTCSLRAARSTDHGSSWSTPAVLATSDSWSCSYAPRAWVSPGGSDVAVAWNNFSATYSYLETVFSSDGGATWTAPVHPPKLLETDRTLSWLGVMAGGVSSGVPVVAVAYLDVPAVTPPQPSLVVATTKDRGQTWSRSVVGGPAVWSWSPQPYDVAMAMSGDGSHLALLMRAQDLSSTVRGYVSVSADTGASWTGPTVVTGAGVTLEYSVSDWSVTVSDAGNVGVLWQEKRGDGHWYVVRGSSTDSGIGWSTAVDVQDVGTDAAGGVPVHARTVVSDDGARMVTVWNRCVDFPASSGVIEVNASQDGGATWTRSCVGGDLTFWDASFPSFGSIPSVAASSTAGRIVLAGVLSFSNVDSTARPSFSVSPALDVVYDSNDEQHLSLHGGGVVPGSLFTPRPNVFTNAAHTAYPVSWNTASDGSGTSVAADGTQSFTMSADTVLYAQWAGPPAKVALPGASAGIGQAMVTWSAPSANGSAITSYDVEKAVDAVSPAWSSVSGCSAFLPSPLSCTAGSLVEATAYVFRVRARNPLGAGPWSDPSAPVTTPGVPSTPATPTATTGVGQVTLGWSAPATNGSAITSYEVEYMLDSNSDSWHAGNNTCVGSIAPTQLSCIVNALSNATAYRFHVRARNGVGYSSWSGTAIGTTAGPPSAPGAPTLEIVGKQINVSWTAPPSNGSPITNYSIQYRVAGTSTWTTVPTPSNSTTYGLGLSAGTTYDVRVAATNALGTSAYSPQSTATTASPPAAPAVPSLTPAPSQITVGWSAPNDGGAVITSFTVQYKLSSSATWLNVSPSPSGTTTSVTVTGLTAGGQYDFRVAASNVVGTSPYSPTITGTVPNIPTAPTSVTGTVGPAQIAASWVASNGNGSVIDAYEVERATSKTGTFNLSCTTSATNCTFTGLANGTAYYLRVRAHNGVGFSAYSAVAGPFTTPNTPATPAAPTGTAGNQQVTLTWKAPANGGSAITGYEVQQSVSATTPVWVSVTSPSCPQPINALTCVVDGLTNGTSYVFRVRAINAVGPSAWSAASAALKPALTVPSVVTGISWAHVATGSGTLSWSPNASKEQVTRYEFMLKLTSATKWPSTWTSNGSSTSVAISALTAGSSYDVRVRAVNSVGAGTAGQISFLP